MGDVRTALLSLDDMLVPMPWNVKVKVWQENKIQDVFASESEIAQEEFNPKKKRSCILIVQNKVQVLWKKCKNNREKINCVGFVKRLSGTKNGLTKLYKK